MVLLVNYVHPDRIALVVPHRLLLALLARIIRRTARTLLFPVLLAPLDTIVVQEQAYRMSPAYVLRAITVLLALLLQPLPLRSARPVLPVQLVLQLPQYAMPVIIPTPLENPLVMAVLPDSTVLIRRPSPVLLDSTARMALLRHTSSHALLELSLLQLDCSKHQTAPTVPLDPIAPRRVSLPCPDCARMAIGVRVELLPQPRSSVLKALIALLVLLHLLLVRLALIVRALEDLVRLFIALIAPRADTAMVPV
jgi:hypothetical protein